MDHIHTCIPDLFNIQDNFPDGKKTEITPRVQPHKNRKLFNKYSRGRGIIFLP